MQSVIVFLAFPIIYLCVVSGNKKLLYKVHFLPPHIATIVLFLWGVRIIEHHKERVDANRQLILYIQLHLAGVDSHYNPCSNKVPDVNPGINSIA